MKKTFTKLNLFIASLLLVFSSLTAGFADWVYSQATITKTVEAMDDKEEPVAYINTDETKFYTIEDALSKATALSNNGNTAVTVYVKPWMNGVCTTATIKKDCVITKNVSLVLPYDGTDSMDRECTATSFADSNASSVKTNRASNISIASGITLTNNGTLTIGGQLGGNGSPNIQGLTSGKYSQITMNSESKIVSSGTLNVYGYIKQSSKDIDDASVSIINGGTIYAPMVMYDFRGGSHTLNMIERKNLFSTTVTGGVFPMAEYDFPNVQCWARINYGAKYIGLVDIYANNKHNLMEPELFGTSSGLFRLSSGSISMKYCPTTWSGSESYTIDDKQKWTTKIKVNATSSLNSIAITISVSIKITNINLTIDSSKFYLPLSYKFDIEVCSGATFAVGYDVKFMTGSKIVVDEGGTAIVNSNMSAYTSFADANSVNARYPSLSAAELIVNGTLTLASGKSYGGIIKTQKAGIKITTSKTVSVTTKEMSGTSRVDHTESLQGYNASGSLFTFSTSTTYTSKLSSDGTFYYWST